MPSYQVTAPDGRKFRLTGDSPPTEQELEQVFSSIGGAPKSGGGVLESLFGSPPLSAEESAVGAVEPAAAQPDWFVGGAVGGLRQGVAGALRTGVEAGLGATAQEVAAPAIEKIPAPSGDRDPMQLGRIARIAATLAVGAAPGLAGEVGMGLLGLGKEIPVREPGTPLTKPGPVAEPPPPPSGPTLAEQAAEAIRSKPAPAPEPQEPSLLELAAKTVRPTEEPKPGWAKTAEDLLAERKVPESEQETLKSKPAKSAFKDPMTGRFVSKELYEKIKMKQKKFISAKQARGEPLSAYDEAGQAHLDPDETFKKDPLARSMLKESSAIVGIPNVTQPINVFNDPVSREAYTMSLDAWHQDRALIDKEKSIILKATKGLSADERSDVAQALRGVRRMSDNELVQTLTDVPPKIDKIAKLLKDRLDRSHSRLVGVDRRTFPILRELNLVSPQTTGEEQAALLTKLKAIQDGTADLTKVNHLEMEAAQRLYRQRDEWGRGSDSMLRFDRTHDLQYRHTEGMSDERELLQAKLRDLEKDLAVGTDPAIIKQVEAAIQRNQALLDKVSALPPREGTIPRGVFVPRKAGGPNLFNTNPEIIDAGYAADPIDAFISHLDAAMHTRTMNKIYTYMGDLRKVLAPTTDPLTGEVLSPGDKYIHDFIPTFVNTLSGAKALRHDIWAARFADSFQQYLRKAGISEKEVTEEDIKRWTGTLARMNLLRIFLPGSRFAVLHGMQAVLHGLPIASVEPGLKFANFGKGLASAASPKWWRRAMQAGVVESNEPMLVDLDYRANQARTLVGRSFLWMINLLSKYPKMVYNTGRVVTFRALAADVARAGFEPNPMIDRMIPQAVKRGTREYAEKYVAQGVRVAMFDYQPIAKPTALTQGGGLRLVTPFRQFGLARAAYLKDILKLDKKGAAIAGSAMYMFGGLGAVAGSATLYEATRHALLGMGIDFLPPPTTGLSNLADRIKLGAHTLGDYLPDVDVSKHVSPLDAFMPPNASGVDKWFMNFVGGPIISSHIDLMKRLVQDGPAKAIPDYISSGVPAIFDSIKAIESGQVLTRNGKKIVQSVHAATTLKGKTTPWIHGLSLNPTAWAQKKAVTAEYEALMQGGFVKQAQKVLEDARAKHGIVFTFGELSTIQHRVERRRAAK